MLGSETHFNEAQMPVAEKRKVLRFCVQWMLMLKAERCANCRSPFQKRGSQLCDGGELMVDNSCDYGMPVCATCARLEWVSAEKVFVDHGLPVSNLIGRAMMRNSWGVVYIWRPHLQAVSWAVAQIEFRYKRVGGFLRARVRTFFARRHWERNILSKPKEAFFEKLLEVGKLQQETRRPVSAFSLQKLPPWRLNNSRESQFMPRIDTPHRSNDEAPQHRGKFLTCFKGGDLLLPPFEVPWRPACVSACLDDPQLIIEG